MIIKIIIIKQNGHISSILKYDTIIEMDATRRANDSHRNQILKLCTK